MYNVKDNARKINKLIVIRFIWKNMIVIKY